MENKFSDKLRDVLSFSREEAERLGNSYIGPEHLMLGLLRDGEGRAIEALTLLHADLTQLKRKIEDQIKTDTTVSANDLTVPRNTERILKILYLEARSLNRNIADTEHLLLAILKEKDNLPAQLLNGNDVNYDNVREVIEEKKDIHMGGGFPSDEDEDEDLVGGSKFSQQKSDKTATKAVGDTPVLNNFGNDLTKAARENMLDPVVGRQQEIERVAQILSRRKKIILY